MKIYENDEKNLASELSGAIIEQVEILEICLYAHAHLKDANDKIHEYLVDSFYDHKKYVDNHFGRTVRRYLRRGKQSSEFTAAAWNLPEKDQPAFPGRPVRQEYSPPLFHFKLHGLCVSRLSDSRNRV